jgi:hypothetical protein
MLKTTRNGKAFIGLCFFYCSFHAVLFLMVQIKMTRPIFVSGANVHGLFYKPNYSANYFMVNILFPVYMIKS